MRKIYFVLWMIFLSSELDAQHAPGIEWAKTYGGSGYDEDYGSDKTLDGGYIIASYTESSDGDIENDHGGGDIWITKINSNGVIQWKKNYGGSGEDFPYSIKSTPDGGYIFIGTTTSTDGDVNNPIIAGISDVWIVKLDSEGDIQWSKTFNFTSGEESRESGRDIIPTSDGGYAFIAIGADEYGYISPISVGYLWDTYIMKINAEGEKVWMTDYGDDLGSGFDNAVRIIQTEDEGYAIFGDSTSTDIGFQNHGERDYYLLKLDSYGTMLWVKNYGGNFSEEANDLKLTADGGFILSGISDSQSGDVSGNYGYRDIWVVKANSTGDIEWEKNYGGSKPEYTGYITPVKNGYLLTSSTMSDDGDISYNHGYYDGNHWITTMDIWIVKLDLQGNILWEKSYGGTGYDGTNSNSFQTVDNGYLIFSHSGSADGDVLDNRGSFDTWAIKLLPEEAMGVSVTVPELASIYPNPVRDILNFKGNGRVQCVQVLNMEGRIVVNQKSNAGTLSQIDLVALPEGNYIVKVQTSQKTHTFKIIKK